MNTIETGAVSGLMMLLSGSIGYLMKRKKIAADVAKVDAEAESTELDNVEKAISIWRNLAESLEQKVVLLTAQVHSLVEENKALRITVSHLESKIEKLKP